MRNRFRIALLLVITALASVPARPQTSGTNLVLHAHWDTGAAVSGTVTLSQLNATSLDTVLVTRNLLNGGASFTTVLASNSLYHVTVTSTDGTQLIKFPFTTTLINPANLGKAVVTLVFNRANKSVKSATVNVSMSF
jgi:hypothetical protein